MCIKLPTRVADVPVSKNSRSTDSLTLKSNNFIASDVATFTRPMSLLRLGYEKFSCQTKFSTNAIFAPFDLSEISVVAYSMRNVSGLSKAMQSADYGRVS